jgi:hypothetical protein
LARGKVWAAHKYESCGANAPTVASRVKTLSFSTHDKATLVFGRAFIRYIQKVICPGRTRHVTPSANTSTAVEDRRRPTGQGVIGSDSHALQRPIMLPRLSLSRAFWLVVVAFASRAAAEFLADPDFVYRFDSDEAMGNGNGMAGALDGRVYATTQAGNLWTLDPLNDDTEPVVYRPPVFEEAGISYKVSCQSSVILQETEDGTVDYAMYMVADMDPSTGQVRQSRLLAVDPEEGSLLWFVRFEGAMVQGNPAVGQEFIYVVHNNVGGDNRGQLSLVQVTSRTQATLVDTVTSPGGVGTPWAPPAVTTFPEATGNNADPLRWKEIVVWGDFINLGLSRVGSLHSLRVAADAWSYQLLSEDPGSTTTAPALGLIGQAGNGNFEWTVATSNAGGLLHAWTTQADWNPFLERTEEGEAVDALLEPEWLQAATQVTTGQFPVTVSPILSASNDAVYIAGSEGGLAGWETLRGRRQWELASFIPHQSQFVMYEPEANNDPTVLYYCDVVGTLRQVEPDRGVLNWQASYCDFNEVTDCPFISADILASRNGNRVYMANAEGSVFGALVASFATPAPTPALTSAPTSTAPTTTPTSAPWSIPTSGPSVRRVDPDGTGTEDGGSRDPPLDATPAPSPLVPGLPAGNEATVEDDSKSAQLYILLAVVVIALCICVGVLSMVFKRRKNSKEHEDREMKEEMAAVRRWKSNKKMCQDEMRNEEEEFMNDLGPDAPKGTASKPTDATEPRRGALVTPRRNRNSRADRRSRSRSSGRNNTPGTLDSISEAADEEVMSSPGAEELSEVGMEVSLDGMEKGESSSVTRNLVFDFTMKAAAKSAKSSKTVEAKADSGNAAVKASKVSKNGKAAAKASKTVDTGKPSAEAAKATDSVKAAAKVSKAADVVKAAPAVTKAAEEPNAEEDVEVSWSMKQDTLADEPPKSPLQRLSRANSTGTFEPTSPSNRSFVLNSPSTVSSPGSPFNDIDDVDEGGSDLRLDLTDEPGRIRPAPPPVSSLKTMHSDDDMGSLLSALSGKSEHTQNTDEPGRIRGPTRRNTRDMNISDVMSVDTSVYLDDNTAASPPPPAFPSPIRQPEPTPPRLSPPGGASIEPMDRGTLVNAPNEAADSPAGTRRSTAALKNNKSPASCMMPALSIASEETMHRSNSFERMPRSYSSTRVNARMISTPEDTAGIERPRSRAGLFSRHDRAKENATTASNQSSSNVSTSEFSDTTSGAYTSDEDMRIVGTAPLPPKRSKAKSREAKGREAKQPEEESGKTNDEGNPWNSFINQLAKADQDFFNPTLPKKSPTVKPKQSASRQFGRSRSAKPNFPPPPPPPSHTDVYYRRDDDSEQTQTSEPPRRFV